jgi:hypothetical protein
MRPLADFPSGLARLRPFSPPRSTSLAGETRLGAPGRFGEGATAMITGCNTNVRHRSKMFHVQTEDSGRKHAHIISHVYHGGTIIASEKSEYRDRVDSEDLDAEVRGLIEEQHQVMLTRLRGGELDAVINERLNGGSAAASSSGDTTAAGADTDPAIDGEEQAPNLGAAGKGAAPSFGESADSEKPLDEVILEYLVDKARERSRDQKGQPRRQQRPKE